MNTRGFRDILWNIRPIIASDFFLRETVARSISRCIEREAPLLKLRSDEEESFRKLEQKGFLPLGRVLKAEEISHLEQQLPSCLFKAEAHPVQGSNELRVVGSGQLKNLLDHDEAMRITLEDDELYKFPYLITLALRSDVLRFVSNYMGCLPILDRVQLWVTLPNNAAASNVEVFHRDRDCFKSIKLFVYLWDVTTESGPHEFITTSHTSDGCKKFLPHDQHHHLSKLFAGSQRPNAQFWENIFRRSGLGISITGSSGTAFLECTYGLHRATRCLKKPRAVFQATYTLLPWSDLTSSPMPSNVTKSVPLEDVPSHIIQQFTGA